MLADKLNYGDTIGVIGVSNSLKFKNDYERLEKAKKLFIEKGFKLKFSDNVKVDYYGSAGTKEHKAKEFMKLINDKDVKAIICLTGGQTCNTFIDLLNYEEIKNNPKIIVGYSDVTVLLNAINKKTGLITFSGPNFLSFGENYGEEQFEIFVDAFVNKKISKINSKPIFNIKDGFAKGKVIGTNLGCLIYLIGTEYFPNLDNCILFIESYKTSPNECQRRFSQLKQIGAFEKIRGVVIGYNYNLQKVDNFYPQMEDILLDYTGQYKFPIMKCNTFGHKIVNNIIPIGIDVEMNGKEIKILLNFLN